jgi:hypothetical protein
LINANTLARSVSCLSLSFIEFMYQQEDVKAAQIERSRLSDA